MNKGSILSCGKDGKWETYDDAYDITIHCESKQEMDDVLGLLSQVGCNAATAAKNMAAFLKDFCKAQNYMECDCCGDCCFCNKENGGCRIGGAAPEDWDV